MPITPNSMQTRNTLRAGWKFGIVVAFAAITLARIIYVSLYAAPIPFWDQWDELNTQYRPWVDGTWHLMQLFAPHNDHRVAFTRLVNLFLIALNGHVFDNLVVAYANTVIYAGLWALVFALLTRNASRNARVAVLVCVIVLGVLPFDFQNVLFGLQNAFYFIELAAAALLAFAAYRENGWPLFTWLVVLAVASLFTMASGLLAAPAVCAVLALRAWRNRTRYGITLATIVAMVVVAGLGLWLWARTHSSGGFDANSTADFLRAWVTALMWPLQPFHAPWILFAIAIWSPLLFWLWHFARTRSADDTSLFAAGLAVWVLLQCLAIAWSRGLGLNTLPSRYMEIPALGLVANLTLALKLVESSTTRRRWAAVVAIALMVGLTGSIFYQRTPTDFATMVRWYRFGYNDTANVAGYFEGRPLPTFPAGNPNLPYPKAARLKQFLDMPDMQALLPPSLFPPPASSKNAPLSSLAAGLQRFIRNLFPTAMAAADRDVMVSSQVAFTRYEGGLPLADTNRECALDGIDGRPAGSVGTIARLKVTTFHGWAGNGHGHALAEALLILRGDHATYAAPLVADIARPDVVRALKQRGLADSGYRVIASVADVSPGAYALYITDKHATDVTCNLHRTVTVQ